jgi:hypothetical protein
MEKIEKKVREHFDKSISNRERAIFEGGISLGSLLHQYIGTPVINDRKFIKDLENTIRRTMGLQPYREKIEVKINKESVKGQKNHQYDYEVLTEKHLDVRVIIKFGNVRAAFRMKFIPELNYSLMYVEKINNFR